MGSTGDHWELRLLVLEGQEIVRRGFADMLREVRHVRSWNAVASAGAALAALESAEPFDVLVAGTESGAPVSAEVLQHLLRSAGSPVRVLVLVHGSEPGTLTAVSRLNADGYLMTRDLTVDSLRRTLVGIRLGDLPLPAPLSQHLLADVRAGTTAAFARLTPRELDVLGLLIDGCTNQQAAQRLGISVHGVKRHVSSLMGKLNSSNRADAVARALTAGVRPAAAGSALVNATA